MDVSEKNKYENSILFVLLCAQIEWRNKSYF